MGAGGSVLDENDTTSLDNYHFYSGKIPCRPDGLYIDEIHKKWYGDYEELESNHSYIQWLFPIREGGLNFRAQPLSKYEASLFQKSDEIKARIVKSYEMMLDFYGLVLKDKKTGQVERNPKNYRSRYIHLNNSFHNYLRITRICKCLGLVGFEHYKLPFIKHMITEVFKNKELNNAMESLVKYWMPTLRKVAELEEAENLVHQYTGKRINPKYYDEEEPSWANVRIGKDGKPIIPPPRPKQEIPSFRRRIRIINRADSDDDDDIRIRRDDSDEAVDEASDDDGGIDDDEKDDGGIDIDEEDYKEENSIKQEDSTD